MCRRSNSPGASTRSPPKAAWPVRRTGCHDT
jgi:hypothetical protein